MCIRDRLLDVEKVKTIVPYVNQLIINNYCLDMKLHDNIKVIYEYVKAHPEEFKDVDILIQMRYLKEVLTNRAGSCLLYTSWERQGQCG